MKQSVMPEATDLAELPTRELLRLYQKHLPPGVCYFIAERDSVESAKITEIHVPAVSERPDQGVTFGFFEKGFPPPDHAAKEMRDWLQDYPFSHHVTSTSTQFQEKLSSHIRGRLVVIDGQCRRTGALCR